jgi:hypothetical protein
MGPLNREVEVLVGPLPDWKGGGSAAIATRFFGDGTTDNLRIKFTVQKHCVSTASPSTVTIYNLGKNLRNALINAGAQVVVSAGWSNVGRRKLFTGGLLNAVSQREGADIATTLSFLAGYGAKSRAVSSLAAASGKTLASVVFSLASNLPEISVEKKRIIVAPFVFGKQGWSFVGSTTDALDKLARQYGFSWWVSNNQFYACDDNSVIPGNVPVVTSKNGFLLRAEPILSSPYQQQAGVTISSLFNPLIDVGRAISVESDLNPGITGTYKVHTLTHRGDTHSSSWETSLESYTYGLAGS